MARSLSLRRLLNDPEFESIRRSVGEFGRSPDNPIPVFGIPGEIHYSSQLRTEAGAALMFHRIRSLGTGQGIVDLYEVLAVDRSVRELLYLSMYSARQSVRAPAGYRSTYSTTSTASISCCQTFQPISTGMLPSSRKTY